MQLHRDIDHIPSFNNAVLTIGTFDGVHLGHQKILSQLREEAEIVDGETVIITFDPHPRQVINAGAPMQMITTINERIDLIAARGIQHLVAVPFTEVFAGLTPREYIEKFLVEKFHPHTIIIGYDHRYGHDRKGDYALLCEYRSKGIFAIKEIPPQVVNDNTVSSTLIREAILKGDIQSANALLGYDFFFEGKVIPGDKRGRALGFPTANLTVESKEKLIPANGVYAITADLKTARYPRLSLTGMMNIGLRPTVDGSTKTIEAHLFGFSSDIYGETLRVCVKKFLRPEQKFNGLEELKEQLKKDKADAKKALQLSSSPSPGTP